MRILYVEGNPKQAGVFARGLTRRDSRIQTEWAATFRAARAALDRRDTVPAIDLVVCAMDLPDGTALSFIRSLKAKRIDVPVVVMIERVQHKEALSLLEAGAMDYVVKDDKCFSRLPAILRSAIHRSIREKSTPLRVLYASNDKRRISATRRHFSRHAPSIRIESVSSSRSLLRRFPLHRRNLQREARIPDLILADYYLDDTNGIDLVKDLLQARGCEVPVVLLIGPEDGESGRQAIRLGAAGISVITDDYLRGLPEQLLRIYKTSGTVRDLTERKKEEDSLREEAAFLEAIVSSSFSGILVNDMNGKTLFVNNQTLDLWKIPQSVLDAGDGEAWKRHVDGMVKNREHFAEKLAYLQNNPNETLRDELELVDGTILERYSSAVLGKDGKYYGRVWAFHDITERRAAEEALWRSSLQLSEAMDLGRMAYWEADPDVPVLVLNDSFYALYGTTAEEQGCYRMSLAEYARRFVHEDDREGFLQGIAEVKANEATIDFAQLEHRFVRRDGSMMHVLSRSRNIKDANGKVFRIYGADYDITELKAATQALKESEMKYRTLFDYAPIGLMQIDGSGVLAFIDELRAAGVEDLPSYVDTHPEVATEGLSKITFIDVNNTALDLFGAASKEDFYRRYMQHIGSMDHDLITRRFLKVAKSETHDENEDRVITSSGKMVYLNSRWVVAPGYERTHERILFSFVDITARKEAAERLRESEQKYRDIFESAVEGIFQSTPSGDFLNVNPAYARMFGYDSPEEFLANAKNVRHLLGKDSASSGYLESLEQSDVATGIEHQFVKKDGKTIWVWVSARAVRGADGAVLYHEGTTENITERKEAEEERHRLQSQLRQSQKMEAIGTLAGGVAHDFNNILTVLTGYGTLLQMRIDKKDPNRMYVDQIMSASLKASNLTHSLLAFSRQQPISLAPVDIDGTIKGTEKLLRRLLTEDITLRTVTESNGQTVMADVTQIDQILFNLVTNARDAMPRGGTLIIETKLVDLDEDFRRMHGFGRPGRYVLMSVSDTGTGMDEQTREQIFVPFFTTKEVGKGTGLGLSTVYGIVKQHNGYITLYSEQGTGTAFHIYLPVADSAQIEAEVSVKPIRKGTEKILVAEDNSAVRRLVCEILSEWGYRVIAAEDGEEAVEKFLTNRDVHLLLFDSVMPRKNGREAYDTIHRIDPNVKVIFTSGYTRDIILDKGIEEKRFDFISKPLQRNKLLEQVREVLDRTS